MISCNENAIFNKPVNWVVELIQKAYKVDLINDSRFNVTIGSEIEDQIQVSDSFYSDLLLNSKFEFQNYFKDEPLILLPNGKADYISSIFYLVNGFQEYNLKDDQKDKYGRLDYKHTLQSKFNVLEEDLVKKYVQKLLLQIDENLKIPENKSRIFISHDIDSVYGSLKYDGLWALRSGNIIQMMKVILQTALQKPPWFNMDKVAALENEYDIKACYYWIVKNGRSSDGIKNGDYKIEHKKIQQQLKYVRSLNNEIGLHKSTMESSFEDEYRAISGIKSNRFHFLKINNPSSFKEMEATGIQSDSSVGFPYHMGFKNSFGMPYYPYDIDRNEEVKVLEIPLQIMDGMFDIKDSTSSLKAFTSITEFIEANKTNAIISILWHNSEMTNFAYKWSFECYKKLLQYIIDMNFESVLPSQLVDEYESA